MASLPNKVTLFLTALAPIIWGSTYIVTTELLPANSPLFASLVRALPAGILVIAFTRAKPYGCWWLKLMLLSVLNIGGFFYCLFYAATHLPGGIAALVMSSQPLLVIFLSRFLLSSRLQAQHLFTSALGIVGIGMMIGHSAEPLNKHGLVLAMLGTISMAIGVVLTKKWGRPKNINLLGFTGWQLLFGGIFLLPVTLYVEGLPHALTFTSLAGYIYLSVFGALISYFLWFRGIEHLAPTQMSFIGLFSSVSACALGYFILDEKLTGLQLSGASVICASILLATATLGEKKGAQRAPQEPYKTE